MRASAAAGYCCSTVTASAALDMARGSTYRSRVPSRYSASTIVRNAGCAPRRSVIQSTNVARASGRALPPNHRCRCRNGMSACRSMIERMLPSRIESQTTPAKSAGSVSWSSASGARGDGLLQLEPEKTVRRERHEVWVVANPRKLRLAEKLDRRQARELREGHLDRLHRARE